MDDVGKAELLFAYGTLGPEDEEAERAGGWRRDAVRGRLFDLGPYPVLVDLDEGDAGWVEGHVRLVSTEELERDLDPYEGVGDGAYGRRVVETREGRRVWVYIYLREVPSWARGPLPRWDGPRRRLARGAATEIGPTGGNDSGRP